MFYLSDERSFFVRFLADLKGAPASIYREAMHAREKIVLMEEFQMKE